MTSAQIPRSETGSRLARRLRPRLTGVAYGGWWLARRAVAVAPLRVSYRLAGLGAAVGWLLASEQRRNAIANYRQMLGPAEQRFAPVLARRSFAAYARYAIDFMRSGALSDEQMLARVAFDEWEKIEAIAATGRGCIAILMHFGDWDVGGQVLALRGYRLNAVAETQPGRINADFTAIRERRGARLIPMERGAASIVRALKRGQFLAILIDRPLDEGGVEVEFFGGSVRLPDGPARLALRTGAAVITVAVARNTPNSDRVQALLDFSIELPHSGNADADVRELTQRIMSSHERIIRRYPEQWYMFRRFWRDGPA
jgi:phosphatidylinositol dimannoside acyltransferase